MCAARAIHGFQNGGSTDAKFLAIASPGVFGPAYFREVGEVLAASAGGPPDLAALAQVMLHRAHAGPASHHLTPAAKRPKETRTTGGERPLAQASVRNFLGRAGQGASATSRKPRDESGWRAG